MKHWREFFTLANRLCWQAASVPENRVNEFVASGSVACTENMYQAFKARLQEEGLLVSSANAHSPEEQLK